jgi:hypothetical protein
MLASGVGGRRYNRGVVRGNEPYGSRPGDRMNEKDKPWQK